MLGPSLNCWLLIGFVRSGRRLMRFRSVRIAHRLRRSALDGFNSRRQQNYFWLCVFHGLTSFLFRMFLR